MLLPPVLLFNAVAVSSTTTYKSVVMIPEERWFTNLYDKGNVGAAALFLLLDDLMRSGRLVPGQRILCAVPESGQCVMGYAALTVVEGDR